jgi:hypothetical protein
MEWEPTLYANDPTVNALLNIAAGLHAVAKSTNDLYYAFAYSKTAGGMSISEALGKMGDDVTGAIAAVAESIESIESK